MKRLFKEYHNYLLLLLITIVFSISLISISYYNSKHTIIKDITKLNLFNVDTLIIVSHPSDEVLWTSSELINNNCLVVCISCTNNQETTEFIKNLNYTNDLYLTLEYPEYKDNTRTNWNIYKKDISKDIKKILNTKRWTTIITHNPNGEYGNIHHKLISNIVTENTNNKDILYFFQEYHSKKDISNYYDYLLKLDPNILQTKYYLLSNYNSKDYILDSYSHIIPYEELIPYRKWGEIDEKNK